MILRFFLRWEIRWSMVGPPPGGLNRETEDCRLSALVDRFVVEITAGAYLLVLI